MLLTVETVQTPHEGKMWQAIEVTTFVGVGTMAFFFMRKDVDFLSKVGYATLSFFAGKGVYFATKAIVDHTSLKDRRIPNLGRVDRIAGVALGLVASAFLGTCLLSQNPLSFTEAFLLAAGSYLPAVMVRRLVWTSFQAR